MCLKITFFVIFKHNYFIIFFQKSQLISHNSCKFWIVICFHIPIRPIYNIFVFLHLVCRNLQMNWSTKSPNCWLLQSHFASLRLVAYAVFQKQIYCIYGSNKCKFKITLNLIQSNTVAQRRGFIYFIFERLRGDRRRNCMSFANNSF